MKAWFLTRKFPAKSVRAISVLSLIALAGLLGSLLPATASAQAVPSRTYQLQEYRRISPPPPSNADRVRMDVYRATNPYTGTVDRRVLEGPNVPIQLWPSQGGVSTGGSALSAPDQPIQPWPFMGGVPASGGAIEGPDKPIQQWPEQRTRSKAPAASMMRPLKNTP